MILKNSIIILCLAFVISCGSSKTATTIEQLPNWIKQKPHIEGHYVGFGSAQKTMNTSEYKAAAKNKALSDLASEISVNISSSSVMQKFESKLGFAEDFSSSTKLNAKESLAGYEQINSYESETEYYVLYKLNKSTYKQLKQQKKSEAISKAHDFLKKAETNIETGEVNNAIINYIKGVQYVKPYFSESLEYKGTNGESDLGNDLFDGFITAIANIVIEPKVNNINAVLGKSIGPDQLAFTCKTNTGKNISGLPVIFTFGSKPLRNSQVKSNMAGIVSYQLPKNNNKAGTAYFTATLNANVLATQATNDPLLRKMIRKMDMPKAKIHVSIANPSVFVKTQEKNINENLSNKIIKSKVEQLLTANGYPVAASATAAQFTIDIVAETEAFQIQGKMHTSILKGSIKLYNATGQLVFTRQITNIKGVQLNYNEAGLDAYKNFTENLNRNFIAQIKQALK